MSVKPGQAKGQNTEPLRIETILTERVDYLDGYCTARTARAWALIGAAPR